MDKYNGKREMRTPLGFPGAFDYDVPRKGLEPPLPIKGSGF